MMAQFTDLDAIRQYSAQEEPIEITFAVQVRIHALEMEMDW